MERTDYLLQYIKNGSNLASEVFQADVKSSNHIVIGFSFDTFLKFLKFGEFALEVMHGRLGIQKSFKFSFCVALVNVAKLV